jgi:hypothetical protein
LHNPPDIFVGRGFRFWLTGFRTGELAHWERAFTLAEQTVGLTAARDVCRDFSQWVRLLSEHSHRDLHVLDPASRCFCRDECIAMALVAAHQHQACPALQACAMTLLSCDPRDELNALTGALARGLAAADQLVSPAALDHLVRYSTNPARMIM